MNLLYYEPKTETTHSGGFVLPFSPAGLEHPRQLCSDQREEQVKALGLSSRTANGGASVSLGSSLSLGSSHVRAHFLAYAPIPTHSPDRGSAVTPLASLWGREKTRLP